MPNNGQLIESIRAILNRIDSRNDIREEDGGPINEVLKEIDLNLWDAVEVHITQGDENESK